MATPSKTYAEMVKSSTTKEPVPVEVKTTIIALNRRYGGFSYSKELVTLWIRKHGGVLKRTGPIIDLIKEIGPKRASGNCCLLSFVEIPSEWYPYMKIHEYDGVENIFFDRNQRIKKFLNSFSEKDASHEELMNSFVQLKRFSKENIPIQTVEYEDKGEKDENDTGSYYDGEKFKFIPEGDVVFREDGPAFGEESDYDSQEEE